MPSEHDVAFPRLNLFSYYIYVVGALFGVTAMVTGGVDTGWTFYTPYSTGSPPIAGSKIPIPNDRSSMSKTSVMPSTGVAST